MSENTNHQNRAKPLCCQTDHECDITIDIGLVWPPPLESTENTLSMQTIERKVFAFKVSRFCPHIACVFIIYLLKRSEFHNWYMHSQLDHDESMIELIGTK